MIKDDVTQKDQIITQVKFGENSLKHFDFHPVQKSKEWPLSIKVLIIQAKGMEFCSYNFQFTVLHSSLASAVPL
jgi:hypothetical protein